MSELLERLQQALADRYRLERELGAGGMATVYLAEDLKHRRHVAVKVLRPEIARALGAERFLREIETTARLTHPHILPLLDSGDADGTLYYVMPYVEGESLRERLAREHQLPLDDAIRITREVADALGYAHGHGVVHRDIKPENILLESSHAVVADFGIARAIDQAAGERLTETGVTLGTPAYMSPEQAMGSREVDGRSDVYSLACMLYEMLAAETPYTGPTPMAIMARKLADPLPRISVVRETVPPAVEAVLTKALARLPVDRYQTAGEFAAALAQPMPVRKVPAPPARTWGRHRTTTLAVVTAVAILAVLTARRLLVSGRAAEPPIERLAVLPLTNLMGDTTQGYLVDGLHDLLITELAKLPGLTVISRSSVMGYRNAPKPASEVARELRVDAVVEGSVLRAGDTLHLDVQLIDGRSDRHLWAETYARSSKEVLALPPAAAQTLARHLGATAGSQAEPRMPYARTVDPRAADLFLKGRHGCHQDTPAGFARGIEYLRQAVDADPTFAAAYAALGECYSMLPLWTLAAPQEAFPKAKAAVAQALALDSMLGGAYVTRALLEINANWDIGSPEADFDRALRLSPGAMEVHHYRSYWLTMRMQFDEAVLEARRALEIDPLTMANSLDLGWTYWNARRYDSSVTQLKLTEALDPGSPWPPAEMAWNYTKLGRREEATGACERALAHRDPDDQLVAASCAWVFAHAGQRREARRLLGTLLDVGRRRWLDPYNVAAVYEGLGSRDDAFRWLDLAVAQHSAAVVGLRVDPWFDSLRSDPRFNALLRRAGLQGV